MNDADKKETPGSTPSSSSSDEQLRAEVRESLTLVRQHLFAAQGMEDAYEKLEARTVFLTKLASSRAEHILALSLAVEHDAASRDRQTEAIILNTQRLTGMEVDLEYARAGVDAIVRRLDIEDAVDKALAAAKQATKDAIDSAAKQTERTIASTVTEETRTVAIAVAREAGAETRAAVVAAVREASGVQKTQIVIEREEEGKVGALARAYGVFARADKFTKVLTVLLFFFATSAVLGYFFYKLHAGAEEPQGKPMRPRVEQPAEKK